MMNIAVCDDDSELLEDIQGLIKKALGDEPHQIDIYQGHAPLMERINHHFFPYDVVLLDIYFQNRDITGIDLAREIKQQFPYVQVIFISGILEYALDVYDVDHIYFIKKPVDVRRLKKALDKAMEERQKADQEHIVFHKRGRETYVRVDDILYFERNLRYTIIYKTDGDMQITEKLDDIEAKLDKSVFVRCHNSYIVNLRYMRELRRAEIVLLDGKQVPISKGRYQAVKDLFTDFTGSCIHI